MHKLSQAIVGTIFAILASGVFGCGSREHLRPDFGRQTRSHFQRQRVHAHAAAGKPLGLDSEEAAIIHNNYREQLGADKAGPDKNSPARVLLLPEPKDAKHQSQ